MGRGPRSNGEESKGSSQAGAPAEVGEQREERKVVEKKVEAKRVK